MPCLCNEFFYQVCAAAIFVAVSATGGGGYGHYEEAGYGGGLGDYGGGSHEALTGYESNEIGHDLGGGSEGHHEEFVDYYVSQKSKHKEIVK